MTPETQDGMVLSIWRGLIPAKAPALTKQQIVRFVADAHGLTVADLTMPSDCLGSFQRQRVRARHESMWMMRQVKREDGKWRYSTTDVGAFHGGRDHTSVCHAERAHEKRMAATPADSRAA